MLVVIDTNVLVSGLLNPSGTPASILGLLAGGKINAAYDNRILAEYRDVLARPAFQFEPGRVQELVEFIKQDGYRVVPEPLSIHVSHENDRPFIETGVMAGAEYLITGNLKHYPKKIGAMKVVSPGDFIRHFTGR
jgi:putative PIN family toxin of toxin-antitoxin system